MAQPSMFGIDPAALAQAQQVQGANQALQYANLTPGEQAQYSAFLGGRQLAGAVPSLLGMEDPQVQAAKEVQALSNQFDITTSAGLRDLATAMQQRAQVTGNQSLAGLIPQVAAAYQKAALNEATIADKLEKKTPNIGERVNQQLFASFQRQAQQMGATTPEQIDAVAAKLYDDYETNKRKSVAAAGAPASGQVPLGTIDTAMGIVDKYTGKPKAKLEQISVLGQVGEAVKTNPTLLPQFKRDAVKFAGDNQVGQKEVKDILGSAGFAGDTIDGVNAFLTGAPTNAKIDDVLKGFKVLEKAYADQYNTGRKKAETVLTEGKINDQTRNAVLPPAYNIKPKVTAPAVGTIKGGYRFKGGDPAVEANWEATR